MATTSTLLRMILQATNENPNLWGEVLNTSAIQLLEDAIAGTADVNVTLGNVTLDDSTGGPSSATHQRFMILDINGTPTGATEVIVPTRGGGVWIAANSSGQNCTVKTAAGTGVTVADGQSVWVYADGTNVVQAGTVAASASDSAALGGAPAAEYARLNVGVNTQIFTAGQAVQRVPLPLTAGSDYTPNIALSNAFYHLTIGNFNLRAPTPVTDGAQFSLIVEQGTPGSHTITFSDSAYAFPGGVAPTLSTAFGAFDYLAFEYSSDLGAWIGSQIKNPTAV